MASLRKGKCYRNIVRAYTRRSKVRGKDYIKAIPNSKVVTFNMGELNGKFSHCVYLVAKADHQIRHNALESSRQIVNRHIMEVGNKNYFFHILAYPHHVLRENKMLSGAGADRMQTGMQLAFGRSTGKAAIVKPGSVIFFIAVANQKAEQFARKIINQVKSKLPGTIKIISVEPRK